MSGRVIVVGSVNVDLVVTTERLPAPGETVIGGRFARHHGGKGGNQAVAAARLGASVFFIGAVGGDTFGAEARTALVAEGIDVEGLLTLPDEPTGVAVILLDEDGENVIAVAGGANAALTSVQVRAADEAARARPGDVILVGHEIRTGATHEALRLGRLAGATTILNPAPAGGLGRSTLLQADILTPNEVELAMLAGSRWRDGGQGRPSARSRAGAAHRDRRARRQGSDAHRSAGGRGSSTRHGWPRSTRWARATRSMARSPAALADGLDLAEAARRAVVAASLAVTRAGAREGMPTAAELAAALGPKTR